MEKGSVSLLINRQVLEMVQKIWEGNNGSLGGKGEGMAEGAGGIGMMKEFQSHPWTACMGPVRVGGGWELSTCSLL